jgi:hypothetical protein
MFNQKADEPAEPLYINRNTIKKRIAKIKFENGPAKDTIASSLNSLRKFFLFTGTGFAQPIKANPEAKEAKGISIVPTRSACFIGLRVSLPWSFAVLSPYLDAVNACANS